MSTMKTCTKCRESKPLDKFGVKRSSSDGKRSDCKVCRRESLARYRAANLESVRARARKHAAKVRAEDPERARQNGRRFYQAMKAREPDYFNRQQREQHGKTLSAAYRSNFRWTGPELEIAADYSRSAFEVAIALGRTNRAVRRMRERLVKDPRKIRLAGIPEGTTHD